MKHYRCHYFLRSHREGGTGSFDFMATNNKRAKKYAKAWIREKNKRNKKLVDEKKVVLNDWEIASFHYISRISIESVEVEKETPI